MKISVGIDSFDKPEDLRRLAELGADEFFAGFVPREWSETYGWEIGLNRRTFGFQSQFLRLEDLQEAIEVIHELGKEICLTFNAHDYGVERLPMVHDIVRLVDALGPDSYVVADPALMCMFAEWGIDRPLHLSTGAACFNSETIRFYCENFPVKRVVIPRKMTLGEMAGMVAETRDLDLEFEVMVIGYRCHFNDEFCFSVHCGLGSNLCSDFVKGEGVVSSRFPADWKDVFDQVIADPGAQFEEGSVLDRFRADLNRSLPPPRGLPPPVTGGMDARVAHTFYNNCGLCAIPRLRDFGVHMLKIPVRGSPWQKRRYLQAVRAIADDPAATPAVCRALIRSAGFCADPCSCYYQVTEETE